MFPKDRLILAPYWTDLDQREGSGWYEAWQSHESGGAWSALESNVMRDVKQYSGEDIKPYLVGIVTYTNMTAFPLKYYGSEVIASIIRCNGYGYGYCMVIVFIYMQRSFLHIRIQKCSQCSPISPDLPMHSRLHLPHSRYPGDIQPIVHTNGDNRGIVSYIVTLWFKVGDGWCRDKGGSDFVTG